MTGAESLLRTLAANGIDTCFMNPGTSEMQFVAALDRVPALRGVLCLFEGVCAGAADGYARVTGRPAATLLHLGPGLANGLSNFHNARKARSPIVSIVGEHATPHLQVDAPLSSDIAAFARTVSDAVRTARSADDVGPAASETIAAACAPPGQVAMLIVPADYSWLPAGGPGPVMQRPVRKPPASDVIERVRGLLHEPGTALLLGGTAVNPRALRAAASTGARVMVARNVGKLAAGRGSFEAPLVPYFPEAALPFLLDVRHLILIESEPPVSFFAYPDTPGSMVPAGCKIVTLARRDEDGTAALEALADPRFTPARDIAKAPPPPDTTTPLTLEDIGRTLAACLPDDALIADEMVSSAARVHGCLSGAPPYEFMPVTGGSIGQGLPVAVGAAIAAPHRKVVALEADGSGLYTPQSLWTMARENLDVTVVILANRRYQILEIEMRRTGAGTAGPLGDRMLDLRQPDIDWVQISQGMGVEATRVHTAREFTDQFRDAMKRSAPRLIEAILE